MANPVAEFDRLTRDLTHLLGDWPFGGQLLPGGQAFAALADLEETDDAFIVEVDLPGVERDDIDIEVQDRRLVITGERKERERTGILRRRTRTVGTLHHEVLLPTAVSDEEVQATLADGVLTVTLPKVEGARRRRIPIN